MKRRNVAKEKNKPFAKIEDEYKNLQTVIMKIINQNHEIDFLKRAAQFGDTKIIDAAARSVCVSKLNDKNSNFTRIKTKRKNVKS